MIAQSYTLQLSLDFRHLPAKHTCLSVCFLTQSLWPFAINWLHVSSLKVLKQKVPDCFTYRMALLLSERPKLRMNWPREISYTLSLVSELSLAKPKQNATKRQRNFYTNNRRSIWVRKLRWNKSSTMSGDLWLRLRLGTILYLLNSFWCHQWDPSHYKMDSASSPSQRHVSSRVAVLEELLTLEALVQHDRQSPTYPAWDKVVGPTFIFKSQWRMGNVEMGNVASLVVHIHHIMHCFLL